MGKKAKKKTSPGSIAENRKARHDYQIEESFEAGLALEGWEVKSIRDGRVQLKESYVLLKHNQAWLIGTHITPLATASTHINPDPLRTRKLLLHRKELNKLIGKVERSGYTIVPLSLYWKKNHIKLSIGLAKGKKLHDKRAADKDRSWAKEKQRLVKTRKNLS